jgi:hypothetical protein
LPLIVDDKLNTSWNEKAINDGRCWDLFNSVRDSQRMIDSWVQTVIFPDVPLLSFHQARYSEIHQRKDYACVRWKQHRFDPAVREKHEKFRIETWFLIPRGQICFGTWHLRIDLLPWLSVSAKTSV